MGQQSLVILDVYFVMNVLPICDNIWDRDQTIENGQ